MSPKNYLVIDYYIGQGCQKINNICREAFKAAYEITEFTLQSLTDSIKARRYAQVSTLSDRSNVGSKLNSKELQSKNDDTVVICQEFGINITKEQLSILNLPNVPRYVHCYAWLSRFFYLVGDQEPNSQKIQIDPITVDELYLQYTLDNIGKIDSNLVISKDKLSKIWLQCFP